MAQATGNTGKNTNQPGKKGFFEKPPEATDAYPVWPAATTKMQIDVTVNEESQVWILHDQPFPDLLEWVEFEVKTGIMTFVTKEGKLQDLGLTIHAPMKEYVAHARQAFLVMMRHNEVRDMGLVPLIVRND